MKTSRFLFIAALLFVITASNAQTTRDLEKTTSSVIKDATFINGAWRSEDNKSFNLMYNGYFNFLAQDSAGRWNDVHAGSYVINKDNTITLKVLYSSEPDHIDAENTAEYLISGQTIKIRHFKKLIKHGKDVTDQVPVPAREWVTMVRATNQ
jgi:hypothetical protein